MDSGVYVDLYDIDSSLSPSYNWRDGSMYTVENEVLSPRLIELGYELLGKWHSGEADSFGPLSRCINTRKDGKFIIVVYG